MTTKNVESYFIRTTFRLVIIGTVCHLFSNFYIERPKKFFLKIFYPSLKNIQKWTPKNFKNPKSEHNTQILC